MYLTDLTTDAENSPVTFDTALSVTKNILRGIDERDEDLTGLWTDVLQRAARYAAIRAGWNFLTREKKADTDEDRTIKHDSFIRSLDILSRYQQKLGLYHGGWREALGTDRKVIGDYACYLAMFAGIHAR